MMKILFLADPFSTLKPKGDSSLALLRAAIQQGHESFWAVDSDVSFESSSVRVQATQVLSCEKDGLPLTAEKKLFFLSEFECVFIRKDPPFDLNYVQLCWILSFLEGKVFFLNRPSLLIRYHEKILPLEAVAQGFLEANDIIPTFFGEWEKARTYFETNKIDKIIVKPFWGFGGSDIELLSYNEFKSRHEAMSLLRNQVVQPYLPEVVNGDRRVFFLDGEIIASVVRVPPQGSHVSNLAQGGSAISRELTREETLVLRKLGNFLKTSGIHLAGADLIGTKISEVNITSPTGLRSIEALEGHDYAEDVIAFAVKNAFYGRT